MGKPEISVVVSTREKNKGTIHERNIRKTIGIDSFEYIQIVNKEKKFGMCSAYNRGVAKALGKIIVFVHDDVFFMEGGWGNVLKEKFKVESVGLIGVAGSEYIFAENPGWVMAGRPFIHGHVIHELKNGETYNLTVFSWEKEDKDVVAVDGLFFAVRKKLFSQISFDEDTFDGFHFYDLDICMQIRKTHRCIVTWDILVKHQSGGAFDDEWKKYALRFIQKYRSELPVSCTDSIPDPSSAKPFENFNLKGKAPQITIT